MGRIRKLAEQQRNSFARQKLENFAQALEGAIDPKQGLNTAEKAADLPEHVDTVSEELFHSVTREAIPVEELVDHRHFQTMRPCLERKHRTKNDLILVAEAMNDVAMGETSDLTPDQAEEFARDMWQAIAKYQGPDVLEKIHKLYEYRDFLQEQLGIKLDERRRIYVERARRALNQLRNRSRDE